MHPILFTIGKFNFYTHGILAVIGILLGAVIIYNLAKSKGLNREYLFDNIIFTVLFGIIGARIAYFIVYNNQFSGIKEIFYLWDGGLVSYGGFVFGGFCFWLLIRNQREPLLEWFDIASVGFFLGLAIGRIGDIFAGEYNGVQMSSTLPILKNFSLVPVSLFEAILCFVIFLLAIFAIIRYTSKIPAGIVASLSIFAYSLIRFIFDFWRSETKIIAGLSYGQIFGLLVALGSIAITIMILKVRRKTI